ncbi:MAG: hypothetical protein KJO49_03615 [Bacteroidia bacterium]|nr:hypothetical protein [Bacteroidia bacterium]
MKTILTFCMVLILGTFSLIAQDNLQDLQLTNTDTIPDFQTKAEKLKISGTIYESDGITPAKDVILYIEQADENGDFELRKKNDEKYVYHHGLIKTNADGKYTFYTFIPGNDRRYNQLKQIFPTVKVPEQKQQILPSFLFESDPMLTRKCLKRMAKKDDLTRILKPKKQDGMLVVQKDIVLQEQIAITK